MLILKRLTILTMESCSLDEHETCMAIWTMLNRITILTLGTSKRKMNQKMKVDMAVVTGICCFAPLFSLPCQLLHNCQIKLDNGQSLCQISDFCSNFQIKKCSRKPLLESFLFKEMMNICYFIPISKYRYSCLE